MLAIQMAFLILPLWMVLITVAVVEGQEVKGKIQKSQKISHGLSNESSYRRGQNDS